MEYDFKKIEDDCKKRWARDEVYKVTEDTTRPKLYVLDMFPYPSGAGLHVGHPLGYVASDIYARYKRLKGFNVLHTMGYDAFGLPAEQYAIETGTPPQETTEKAIKRYREQLDKIGLSFDWSREVKTSDPRYYKWTQWIFLKLFNSWYNREKDKAEPIETLMDKFTVEGAMFEVEGEEMVWNDLRDDDRHKILMQYRLAYLSYAEVNWCPALGTVLANDEVKDGKSERGGHPVERKKMRQWFLRITEYSDRLLEGLERLDWSESMKEMQRNWIGRSEGALIKFHLSPTLSKGEGAGATNYGNDSGEGKTNPRYYTTDGQTWNHNLELAKQMRHNPTEAETLVWERLRAKRTGYKFRRQHPVDSYVPDFICLEKGLVVEIDGKIHEKQQIEDKERTEILNRYGLEAMRFTNEEVIADIDGVIEKIKAKLAARQNWDKRKNPGNEAENVPTSPSLLGRGPGGEVVVFTTRPDTIFGATFMVIAAEHDMVEQLTTREQKEEVEKYIAYVKSRTDVERQQEKRVTGVFTGSYTIKPFTNEPIPIWIAEYVLSGYGTGAIMAVPADDERDRKFAEKFGLPVVEIIDKSMYPEAKIEDKMGKMINSGFLNGLEVKDAIKKIIEEIEEEGIGERKVNYKQRDAGFSRQRYWGEPFPIKYKVIGKPDSHFAEGEHDDIPVPISENELPLILPEVSTYKPTGDGRSPLANNKEWVAKGYETDSMPGYAASSWYFLRYMDAHNDKEFAGKDKLDYWQSVDVYFGGAEHAVGHLLYARMWHKFLYDLGYVQTDEPFKKLVNQGMIQGQSKMISVIFVIDDTLSKSSDEIIYKGLIVPPDTILNGMLTPSEGHNLTVINFPIQYIIAENGKYYLTEENLQQAKLDYPKFSNYFIATYPDLKTDDDVDSLVDNEEEYFEKERVEVSAEVEKMSKSKYNVVNPDDVIEKYGADCFRMFEMFLGPLEQSKPWDDKGISGVYNFLRKFWRMYTPLFSESMENGASPSLSESGPGGEDSLMAEFKILHKTLKKIADDIERLSFNTSVSAFMIATNELTALGCQKREILEPLLIALAPFAPFIAGDLWERLGNKGSIHKATFPKIEEKYLVEESFNYPVSINGKVRAQINLSLSLEAQEIERQILEMDTIKKWTNGNPPKKFIFVKGKIINVVV